MSLRASTTVSSSVSDKEGKAYTHATRRGGPARSGHINFVEAKPKHAPKPFGWRKLFKRPVIRQYIFEGHIWREREEREPSRFELFFDLIFVGIIHQLADGATEEFAGRNIAKFLVLFYPSWTIWQDTRTFLNLSGTDDIIQRTLILLTMALLIGYSANASAVELPGVGVVETATLSAVQTAEGIHTITFSTLRAAILFFLVARALRLIGYIVYGVFLPKFRLYAFWGGLGVVIHSAIYFPLIWVQEQKVFWSLGGLGILVEIFMRAFIGVGIQIARRREQKATISGEKRPEYYFPAVNIEHHIERTSQFVIIVIGEAIVNLTYKAVSPETGVSKVFLHATLSLWLAYLLCWLYFDQDASHTYVHALRRHWFSAVTANFLHFPLCSALIVWSSSVGMFVQYEEVSSGVRWYFSGGLSSALFTLGILGWMHKNLDAPGSSLIPLNILYSARLIFAVVIAVLPLSSGLKNSSKNLGVHVGILTFVVCLEMLGKIGTIPSEDVSGEVLVPQGFEGETEEQARREDLLDHARCDLEMAGVEKNGEGEDLLFQPATEKQCLVYSCS